MSTALDVTCGITSAPISPSTTPPTPPATPRIDASTRNWARMTPGVAPSALRKPISRTRSVTDTSMMFITPMPPTSREMAAIPASSTVSVLSTDVAVDRIDDWVVMLKSAWVGMVIWWVPSRSELASW